MNLYHRDLNVHLDKEREGESVCERERGCERESERVRLYVY